VRQALTSRASDVHLEPKGDRLRIRFRIDGAMVERGFLPSAIGANFLSRLKVLCKIDIAEKRNPQDGVFKLEFKEGAVSVRASTFPCLDGEKAVLRLARTTKVAPLEKLGMAGSQVSLIRHISSRTGGLFLVTGPTGSGKTSTLYGVIEGLDTQTRNVVTLEDPIEVPLPNITQGQVNPKAGFTFASGLRSILRQDPDVILVGEMRDEETASVAVQASLTGHLVLSTLHTNSSIDTVARLLDIGLSPYSVANALVGIVSQRLVRVLCECATPYALEDDRSYLVGFPLPVGATVMMANGCDKCHGTGYRGRAGIYEVVEVNDTLRAAITQRADNVVFKQILREMGVPTVRRAGMRLALQRVTTIEDVLRVT
jgi:general secretion pathway protein E/type IV pilus assembly protein PilB